MKEADIPKLDPFVMTLASAVVAASLLPVSGALADAMDILAYALIMFMFFFHGVRLPFDAIRRAVTNWRLHGLILVLTFVLFPIVGLLISGVATYWLPAGIAAGLLYLSLVPSTIQSSVAFIAVAKGDVAAGVASAATSNILGVGLTPLLVGVLLGANGAGMGADGTMKVVALLLAPFLLGHLSRRWLADWAAKRKRLLGLADKSAIVLIVYTAFSAAVLQGIWTKLGPVSLFMLIAICLVLLAVMNALAWLVSVRLPRDQRVTMLFCGTQKSLAAGAPMASLLFAASAAGELLLPLMIYHQAQLVLAAILSSRLLRDGNMRSF
ncbi:bile acid:sodium symporter family protein [Pacificimonas sp. ICDLI1SI03]